ncbi:MAG: acylphosphatase [Novosphingobium sp.]|nr:acylphosphatase [Novosphingobium sp.]
METQRIVHLVLTGRVQAVGFRDFLARKARARSVSGWVRNRRDGAVEATLAGDHQAVEAVIAEARIGPRGSRVDDFAADDHPVSAQELERLGRGFAIRPTA